MLKKVLIWLPVGTMVVMFLVLGLYTLKNSLPLKEIAQARSTLLQAQLHNADTYARPTLLRAQHLYDSSMFQLTKENSRFILFRDFEKAKSLALQSNHLADSAIRVSKIAALVLGRQTFDQIARLKGQIGKYEERYGKFPIGPDMISSMARAKLLLEEGIIESENGNFISIQIKLDSAEVLIQKITDHAQHLLKAYLADQHHWQKWVMKTIQNAKKKHSPCIVIDKYARTCLLYNNGALAYTFEAELGTNWLGDKMHQGDKTTPEGSYEVVQSKAKGATKYYKALLINYPNAEDKIRFANNKKAGRLDQDTEIGGLIEIHGHGGKGIDWTDGCIALKDQDMDILYPLVKPGTLVTIVGSLRSYEEITTLSD